MGRPRNPKAKRTTYKPFQRGAFIRHLQHQVDHEGNNHKLLPEDHGSPSSSPNPAELKELLLKQKRDLSQETRWSRTQ